VGIVTDDLSVYFTFFLLGGAGCLLCLKSGLSSIYSTAFLWQTFFFGLQLFYFNSQYNSFFDKGGDDSYFFNEWILPAYYDIEHGLQEYNPYKSFVLPAALYLKLINFIGIKSISFFHINLINIFIGSFIGVFVYKIGVKIFNERVAGAAAFFVIIYPFLNYQTTKILRDVHVYFYFTLLVLIIISKISIVKKIIFLLILTVILFNVRKEAVIYIMIFMFFYYYLNTNNLRGRLTIIVLLFSSFIIGYSFISLKYGLTIESISRFSELYEQIRLEADTGGSLATMLKNSGFIGKIVSIFYIWISPFPPPVIYSFDFINVIISVGVLFWCFLFPRAIVKIYEMCKSYKKESEIYRRNFALSILVTVILGTFLISYTSGDPRHSMVFFPVFSLFSFGYFQSRSGNADRYLNYGLTVFLLIGILIYIFLKLSFLN